MDSSNLLKADLDGGRDLYGYTMRISARDVSVQAGANALA